MYKPAVLVAICAGLVFGQPAMAQKAIEIVSAARPPYVIDVDGTGRGPAVDLVQEIARAAGIAPEVRILPFQRAIISLDQGNVLYPALLRTPQRETRYVWIGEVYADRAVFFTRRDGRVVNSLDTVRQLPRIGVMRGSELQGMLQSFGLDNYEANNSDHDNARLLHAGRIDGWFTPRAVGRSTWAALGFAPEELRSSESFATMPFWIAGSSNLSPAMVSRLRATYQAMRADGRYRRIIAPLAESPS